MTSRKSSGSMRAESAVEPTRSENITVTWRRSAVSLGEALSMSERASAGAALLGVGAQRGDGVEQLAAVPERGYANSFKSSAVSLGRTVSSISFSRNTASCFPRPRLRSQPPTSMVVS